ncbi:MAG: peptidoglycan DD-metalloendopeptidase family protein [Bacteroidales bacterium]|nr:peptidoglycan DD-metalloendopeptidase family protein [Candidatus Cacconaster scatequi]
MKKSRFIPLILILLAIIPACKQSENVEETPAQEEVSPYGFILSRYECDSTEVKNGEVFTTLMNRLGMDKGRAHELAASLCDTTFDVRRMKEGDEVVAYYSSDSLSRRLEYAVYSQSKIRQTVFRCGDTLSAWNYDKPVDIVRKYTDVTIQSSLWNDMIKAGASPALIMNLADIYQWSVNFFALQEGDRFKVIYNQTVCEDEVISIDTVFFSIFSGGGKEVSALRFQKSDEKKAAYWGKNGESLKRMFLKAPLKYNRISSKFTYRRKHPVTGKVKPHTAVDYAAPKGTPVHAIGDGTITLCGWDGSGGGNRIRIKHAQGYESCYMHLSKFATGMKAGRRVSQGELIGYVGSTGRSTGPHLDFRVWLNKKPIDPLSLNSPSSEPLAKKYLEEFNGIYNSYISEIDSLDAIAAGRMLIDLVSEIE